MKKAKWFCLPMVGLSIFALSQSGFAQDPKACQVSLRSAEMKALELALVNFNPSSKVEKYFYSEPKDHYRLPIAKDGREIHLVERANREGLKITDRIKIEKLMADYSLTRLQAVEVQALLRRFTKVPNDQQFEGAIDLVKQGQTLSGLNVEKMQAAKFVVVLDVDGTLLDQDSKTGFIDGVHKASFLLDGSQVNNVAINDGAIELIRRSRELGASVILFSRNNDILIHTIMDKIEVDGASLRDMVDGVLTSSHMTVPGDETDRSRYLSFSKVIRKDLSIFEVERILIVDDDPEYVLQKDKVRVVSPFNLEKALELRPYDKMEDKDNRETAKITPKAREKMASYFKSIQADYKDLVKQIEFLASKPEQFNDYLALMSPLGREAISLLTASNSDYFLEKHQAVREHEAIAILEKNPEKIYQILAEKKKKEKPKKDNLGPWFGRIFRADDQWDY